MYDAVIIGAGISGLVCGCYLAKAGMKVLIAEQHNKPGGYCTSFKRRSFTFAAAAHSIGGFKYGNFGKIFEDLELDKQIKIKQFNPSNTIVTPDYKVSFWNNIDATINDFQTNFPDEAKNIENFFQSLTLLDPNFSIRIRSLTFKKLLDRYFNNNKLKAVLSAPLMGNSSLPPSHMSAFMGSKIFREYLLDGGYYPINNSNMQALSEALSERFKQFGGEIWLSCLIKKTRIHNNKVTGVITGSGDFIPSRYVISNCDARQTFFKILGKEILPRDLLNKVNKMTPSLSAFILYLGVDKKFYDFFPSGRNIWILSHYNLDLTYSSAKKGNFESVGIYLVHTSPNNDSILVLISAPFKNKTYWDSNKEKLLNYFTKKVEMDALPGLSRYIRYKEAATPYTLYRYTFNHKGAAFGWACTPSQLAITDFCKPSFVDGFYLTGHWTTKGLGIPGVTYIGYDTAQMILRKEKVNLNIISL